MGQINLHYEFYRPRSSGKYYSVWGGWSGWFCGGYVVVVKLGIKANLRSFGLDLKVWQKWVSIDGFLSRLLPVPTGVPQGSILGPMYPL